MKIKKLIKRCVLVALMAGVLLPVMSLAQSTARVDAQGNEYDYTNGDYDAIRGPTKPSGVNGGGGDKREFGKSGDKRYLRTELGCIYTITVEEDGLNRGLWQ